MIAQQSNVSLEINLFKGNTNAMVATATDVVLASLLLTLYWYLSIGIPMDNFNFNDKMVLTPKQGCYEIRFLCEMDILTHLSAAKNTIKVLAT